MTATKVVDASALAALLFDEPEGGAVGVELQDALLFAPVLLDFELANVCLTKMRRSPGRRDDLLTAWRARRQMQIETMEVDHASVLDLAEETGLSAYDASYLWLSRQLDAELVTLDRKLAAAAI